jgi:alkylresorcinol/alkylpyrone synthase
MFIIGLGTAAPAQRHTQREAWKAVQQWTKYPQLKPRSQAILKKVLCGDNGIETRHLTSATLADVFNSRPDELQTRFTTQAPARAVEALRRALKNAGGAPEEIDVVLISTGTGYPPSAPASVAARVLGSWIKL